MANAIVTQRDNQLERQRAGFMALSLTNFTNDDEPTIAAGSVVEISGTLYSVTGNESITGWGDISNGLSWVKLIPAGTDPFTAEYTDVAPTWFDSKQAWYDGTGTDRYVARIIKGGATVYSGKQILAREEPIVLITEEFLTSGNGSLPTIGGTVYIEAIARGGGGAGGGCTGADSRGGGGGGSAFFRHIFPVASTVDYSIGAGGVGVDNADGNDGAPTTITVGADTISAYGGLGGKRQGGAGGAGGTIDSDADFSVAGDNGASGATTGEGGASANNYVLAGSGAVHDIGFLSLIPAGMSREHAFTNANPGRPYGGGGSGGRVQSGGSGTREGGNGHPGAALIRFWGRK